MRLYYNYRYVLYMCLRSLTSLYFTLIAFVQCTLKIKVQQIIITYLSNDSQNRQTAPES